MTWLCGTHSRAPYWVVSLFAFLGLSRGVLFNRTIDDQIGDSVTGILPIYEGPPMNGWEQGSTCKGCGARPDPSLAFQGTWHDSTWHPGDPGEKIVNVDFTGSAVYVFVILANNVHDVTTLTSLSFSLDGEVVGTFVHSPTSSKDYEYNVTAYTNENLTNTPHNLTMQTTGSSASLFLFDYLVYSTDDEVTPVAPTGQTSLPTLSQSTVSDPVSLRPTKSSPPMPAESNSFATPSQGSISPHGKQEAGLLAGGLVGGLLVGVFVTGLILYGYRRKILGCIMNQNPSRKERDVGPTIGLSTLSDWGETTTGTWSSSPTLASTYKGGPTYNGGPSKFSQTVITSPTEKSDGNMGNYVQVTSEAKLQVTDAPTHKPGSQELSKPAERQLQLFRQIERTWQQPGPGIPKNVSNLSSRHTQRGYDLGLHVVADAVGNSQERVVHLLD